MNLPFSSGNRYPHFTMSAKRSLVGLGSLFVFSFAAAGCGGGGTETNPFDAGADGGPEIILDGGGAVAQPPDGPAACPGACNYQTNAGCQPNETCFPFVSGNTSTPGCAPAGAGANGAACATVADCGPGFLCTSAQNGVCRKLCCGGDWTGCADPNERCAQKLSVKDPNGASVATDAMLCVPANNCDALQPASCPVPGKTCQIIDGTGATLCVNEGTGDQGEACPCKGGFVCVAKACRRLCKAVEGGGEPYCQDGEGICVHYNRDPQGVGECTPQDN